METVRTYPLLADAYPARQWKDSERKFLTHAVMYSEAGEPVRVLCGKVKVDNICDNDPSWDVAAAPTCANCAARLKKLRASSGR